MKDVHPLDVAVLVAIESIRGLALLLVHAAALVLTVAGWRPAAAADPVVLAAPTPKPIPAAPQVKTVITQPLTAEPAAASPGGAVLPSLTVAQLRKLARAAGHTRAWCRTARKAELLELLALS